MCGTLTCAQAMRPIKTRFEIFSDQHVAEALSVYLDCVVMQVERSNKQINK